MEPAAAVQPAALSGLVRKLAASLVVVAVTVGPMGLATFGAFDSETDEVTRSVLGP